MICPRCQKRVATVHVTEVQHFVAPGHPENVLRRQSLCETCAQELNLPHAGLPQKALANFWKLLQYHKQKVQGGPARSGPSCPKCGMTLEDLRRRGRVGCERDYQVFRQYLDELLERMHGATAHVGRRPGGREHDEEPSRDRRVADLRDALAVAIREEDYERAAVLRDELRTMEARPQA